MENVMTFPDSNQIKDEAAHWVVKLHGQSYKTGQGIPPAMAAELRRWLSQSDQHRDSFITALAGWDAMAVLEDLADIMPLQEPTPAPATGYRPWQGWATAASLVMITLLVLLALPSNHYSTGIGQQASYTLDDGSILTLNTNSQVTLDYSDNRRAVTLVKGEASFDVAKNPQRPFVVYAGKGMVWAVGTAFNVSYSQQAVDVIVTEGKVKVFSGIGEAQTPPALTTSPPENNPRDTLLVAGQAAQYQDRIVSKQTLPPASLDKKLAWQLGVLLFEGETLEQAIHEIARYTDRELIIVDPSIKTARVGGRFKTDDINALLASLAKSLDLHIEPGQGRQLLLSARQQP
ncbi:FecR family protein [Oceanicoccus sagamiensis]|uniref:FecR protein domain-containing protein n=1 Tax=Oceanicoccus sagamiensis TaxID=716816 RepID=A0A1X9ND32_9GAMM|nr:FecR domain-containing protein [Oceanicoccus sagamiensis]ARN73815.1 hypothetical protein BST96_06625 [Oceanicoccus sagamiensis]